MPEQTLAKKGRQMGGSRGNVWFGVLFQKECGEKTAAVSDTSVANGADVLLVKAPGNVHFSAWLLTG